ncbi:MAG TPA: 2-C-methyl-D-erythritol 2,4-cyclodiphosphate synthase [Synergistetes bacterium]|nr:2-C-methyl-D-erythritol 2,4-cyclodiphosphate synthase [Synergistota bacterium]
MTCWSCIIAAGGAGSRIGGAPKQMEILGDCPMWKWSFKTALSLFEDGVREIIIVAPRGASGLFDPGPLPDGLTCIVVEGGETRRDSVLNGLMAASCDLVLIHDAARPFASGELFKRVMAGACNNGTAIPLVPVSDALKSVEGTRVKGVQERSSVRLTQTPQAFPTEEIRNVISIVDRNVPDEAEAWLLEGKFLSWVEGESMNFKVTYPDDLKKAQKIAGSVFRKKTGIGYDIHPLAPGRPFILGGIHVPFSLGISGHSDGDLLCHALADAILGASGMPDIGTIFPAFEERYKNINSLSLLSEVVQMVASKGISVESADAVITAQVPRLAGWIEEISRNVGKVLFQGGCGDFSMRAKSGEFSGPVGNGEVIACWAVATVKMSDLLI